MRTPIPYIYTMLTFTTFKFRPTPVITKHQVSTFFLLQLKPLPPRVYALSDKSILLRLISNDDVPASTIFRTESRPPPLAACFVYIIIPLCRALSTPPLVAHLFPLVRPSLFFYPRTQSHPHTADPILRYLPIESANRLLCSVSPVASGSRAYFLSADQELQESTISGSRRLSPMGLDRRGEAAVGRVAHDRLG